MRTGRRGTVGATVAGISPRRLPHPPTDPRRIVHPPSPASWFHQAVFYAIDVGSFRDSNGDGYGDLRGVAESLAYLQRLAGSD